MVSSLSAAGGSLPRLDLARHAGLLVAAPEVFRRVIHICDRGEFSHLGHGSPYGLTRIAQRPVRAARILMKSHEPPVQGPLWVDLTRSQSRRPMAAICAKATSRIDALETFEATVVVGLSRPYAVSARQPRPGAWQTPYAGLKSPLFQVKDDRSLV